MVSPARGKESGDSLQDQPTRRRINVLEAELGQPDREPTYYVQGNPPDIPPAERYLVSAMPHCNSPLMGFRSGAPTGVVRAYV